MQSELYNIKDFLLYRKHENISAKQEISKDSLKQSLVIKVEMNTVLPAKEVGS